MHAQLVRRSVRSENSGAACAFRVLETRTLGLWVDDEVEADTIWEFRRLTRDHVRGVT